MATSREVPGWYEPEHTYLVHGGPVESRTDGQIHHVPALQVVRLYGLRTSMHNVVLFNALADALVHLCARQVQAAMDNGAVYHVVGPRSDGDYGTPESVRSWQSRQRITRARDRASSGAISLPPSSTRGVTVNISSQGSGEHPGISDDRAQAMRLLIANLVREGAPGVNRAADSMRRFAEAVRGVSPIATAVANLRAIAQPEAVSGLEVEVTRANPNPYAPTPVSVETAQAWVKASTVPQEGSRAWIRIVKKGCVGERGISGDFDCNDYEWGCDHCPVVVDRMNRESALEKSIKGNRMHRFWRAKAKAKNEIDCKSSTMVGIDPASPGSDRTVMVVRGRRAGLSTIVKRYRKG